MWKWVKSLFYTETFFYTETNTITPNSMAKMPKGKFFNYLIQKADVDEDEPEEIINYIQRGAPLNMEIFFSKYGRFGIRKV